MSDQRPVNIVYFATVCDVYGTDATQFELGTLAYVAAEAGVRGSHPFFVLVDTGDAPGVDTISTVNGPAQPGCTNPVAVGASTLRWRRLTIGFQTTVI